MAFEFDSRTGFLITKAVQRLISSNRETKASDVNVNINVEDSTQAKQKPRGNTTAQQRRQSNSPKMARNNQHNQYRASKEAVSTGGKLFGGEIFSLLSELKMAISVPTMLAKSAISKYREKREAKQDKKSEDILAKESESQTDRLEDILREIKKGKGGGKLGLGKAGAFGAGSLVGGGIKGMIKRLGIAGLVYSVIDGYGENIKKFKETVGKEMSEDLTLSEKMQFASNQIGKGFAGIVNSIAGKTVLSDADIEGFTAQAKESVSTALDNLKENFPKVGGAITDTLTVLDEGLGSVTSYLADASSVLADAFRKKSDTEKEFIKAQDIVRNRDTFGETLTGTNNKEYADAKAKMRELAPQLLKDDEFVKNSAYAQTARDAIDPKLTRKSKKKQQQEHLDKIEGEVGQRELEVKKLEALKKGVENDEFMAKAKMAFLYSSQEAFDAELKAKQFQLEQHKKLAETARKIVEETEKALVILDAGNAVAKNSVETSVDLSGKLWKTSTMEYEGFRGQIYDDSKGYKTIGYGHKLTAKDKESGRFKNGITKEQATELYNQDRAKHDKKLYEEFAWIKDQPKEVQTALEDMAFNMGIGGLSTFKNTLGLIKSGKYKEASVAMMDSQYAKDVGKRAQDNSIRIASASVAKKAKVNMNTTTQKKAVEEVAEKVAKKTEKPAPVAQNDASLATVVKAIEDSNAKVVKSIENGTKQAKEKVASNEPTIIVNIENKSTNQNIGGQV